MTMCSTKWSAMSSRRGLQDCRRSVNPTKGEILKTQALAGVPNVFGKVSMSLPTETVASCGQRRSPWLNLNGLRPHLLGCHGQVFKILAQLAQEVRPDHTAQLFVDDIKFDYS